MPVSLRAHLGWSEQRATMVQNAVNRAHAQTANCRQMIPMGQDQIGNRAVVWPTIGVPAPPAALGLGPDIVASPIHMYVNIEVDDARIDDEPALVHLAAAGAAQLAELEDGEIIMGATAGAPPAGTGRAPRIPRLYRAQFNSTAAPGATLPTPIPRDPGQPPKGEQVVDAILNGMIKLQEANRPGPCGLLLHNNLLRVLRLPAAPGAPPFINQTEQIIGGNKIAGTNALSGNPHVGGETAGILFRLDPPAVAIVQTMLPTLTFLGRTAGQISLRIEEEIVVQILDQRAVNHLVYSP